MITFLHAIILTGDSNNAGEISTGVVIGTASVIAIVAVFVVSLTVFAAHVQEKRKRQVHLHCTG